MGVGSSRSRASSVISTGTKTSITTLPQPLPRDETHTGPIDVVLGRRNFRITARPGSVLSISSFDHPAPPYTEYASPSLSQLPFEGAPGSELQAPIPTRPTTATTENTFATDSTPTPQLLHQPTTPLRNPDSSRTEQPTRTPSPPSPPLSPLSTSTNALSAHYTSVVRTLDANHSAELARLHVEHAASLSRTRHDIDAAYRSTLHEAHARAENIAAETRAEMGSTIEALEARGAELGRLVEELRGELEEERGRRGEEVRRARNEVEDVWEGRWRDRMRLAAEEVRGAWEEGEKVGGLWEGVVRGRWPGEVDACRREVEEGRRR
ncbi:MAG: hypothetical protein MMC23_005078 [Stictis urceolatum]|nr:hypothetical protein [Stictis urceolata]